MEPQLSREHAFVALNGLPAVGPVSLNRLLDAFDGDPCRVLDSSRNELERVKGLQRRAIDVLVNWRQHFNLEREIADMKSRNVSFVGRDHPQYPPLLKEISDPPIGLYRLGKYDFSKPTVAIVGTRHSSLYGQSVAQRFAADLAQMGFCIVSGMARGIDTFAHKGALEVEGGSTVCVFGCGIDIVYPPENVDIYREAQVNGAVISEFPFGRRADRQTFPMRNRVVSGLSHAVIVVESDDAGGSMITAKFAGEQGRVVCAIPGRIDQKSSRGSHQLIRDGAVLIRNVDDLLVELEHLMSAPSLALGPSNMEIDAALPELEGDPGKIVTYLKGGDARSIEEMASLLQASVSETSVSLMQLELQGIVAKRLDGKFELALRR